MLGFCPNGSQALDWTRNYLVRISLRRTKATLIYRRTGNLRAVVRYLGIAVDDALSIAEQVEV